MKYFAYYLTPDYTTETLKINNTLFSKKQPILFTTLQTDLENFVKNNLLIVREYDTEKEANFYYQSPITKNYVPFYSRTELLQKNIKEIYHIAEFIGIATHINNKPKNYYYLVNEILQIQEKITQKTVP